MLITSWAISASSSHLHAIVQPTQPSTSILLLARPIPGIGATPTFPQSQTPPILHLPSYCLPRRDRLSLHPIHQHHLMEREGDARRNPRLHRSEIMEPLHWFYRSESRNRLKLGITIPFFPIQPTRFFSNKTMNEIIIKRSHGEDLDCVLPRIGIGLAMPCYRLESWIDR
jgi:hypothetical protein